MEYEPIRFHTCHWQEADLEALRETVSTGLRERFEATLRAYLETEDGASLSLVGSGRSALRLALESLKPDRLGRDGIILPTYCCPAVLTAVRDAGLKPQYVDIGRDLGATAEQQLSAIDERTLAVVVVNLCGKGLAPSERQNLLDGIRQRGVVSIEDNCHHFVAPRKQSRADMEFYSFAFSKSLSTTGGGALISRLRQSYISEQLETYARQDDAAVETRFRYYAKRFGQGGQTMQENEAFSRARTEFGRVLLSDLDLALADRRSASIASVIADQQRNGAALSTQMMHYPSVFSTLDPGRNSYTRFPVTLADPPMFNRFWSFMSERKIELEGMYVPLHLSDEAPPVLPNAEAVYRRVYNVPVRSNLSEKQFVRIASALNEFAKMAT